MCIKSTRPWSLNKCFCGFPSGQPRQILASRETENWLYPARKDPVSGFKGEKKKKRISMNAKNLGKHHGGVIYARHPPAQRVLPAAAGPKAPRSIRASLAASGAPGGGIGAPHRAPRGRSRCCPRGRRTSAARSPRPPTRWAPETWERAGPRRRKEGVPPSLLRGRAVPAGRICEMARRYPTDTRSGTRLRGESDVKRYGPCRVVWGVGRAPGATRTASEGVSGSSEPTRWFRRRRMSCADFGTAARRRTQTYSEGGGRPAPGARPSRPSMDRHE